MSTANELPPDIPKWKATAKRLGMNGTIDQLGSNEKVKSASKFEYKHFIGLRVIWKYSQRQNKQTLPPRITQQFRKYAIDLSRVTSWNAYLGAIEDFGRADSEADQAGLTVSESLGPFAVPWQYQRHVLLGDGDYLDPPKVSKVSPVVNRTRYRMKMKQLKELSLQSPTPAPRPRLPIKQLQQISLGEEAPKGLHKGKAREADPEDSDDETDEDQGVESDDEVVNDQQDEIDDDETFVEDSFVTPGLNAQGRPINDEQTVNNFLLGFLTALTLSRVPFHTRWVAERNAFVYERKVKYVARTDGHLRDKFGKSQSIIECKARSRHNDRAVRIQESAQIAAWIRQTGIQSHSPEQDCRMFLISEDKDEIFLTFPRFTKSYGKEGKDFRTADKLKEEDFLWMDEYGPFRLDSKEHMTRIATFLLAYTSHVSAQQRSDFLV